MQLFLCKTVILRHRKENLKKCSLRNLENREDMLFLTYPQATLPHFSSYCLLALDGPPLTYEEDAQKGLFLIDGTWRLAEKMSKLVLSQQDLPKRSIPPSWKTAYPRKQEDCPLPEQGLASVEALYAAYSILKRDVDGLLDHYYWKDKFLKLNRNGKT